MRISYSILFIFLIKVSFAQTIYISKNPLLEFLLNSKEKVGFVNNPGITHHFIPLTDSHINNYPQLLVKNESDLFLLVENTGRVYKLSESKENILRCERIDSTHFYGYNGHAILFTFRDTLFSFGGLGFWHRNGQLRYYDQILREWNIKHINEEIHADRQLYHHKTGDPKLYFIQFAFTNEVTGKESKDFFAVELDLQNKSNKKLGVLSQEISSLNPMAIDYQAINLPGLEGVLVNFSYGKQYLLRFQRNEVYRLVNKDLKQLFYTSSNGSALANTFQVKDSLYFTYSSDSTFQLYSKAISLNDFEKEDFPIYKRIAQEDSNHKMFISSAVLLILGVVLFIIVKKRKAINTAPIEKPEIHKTENELDFKPIELEVIRILIQNSRLGRGTNVTDINFTLGIGKKSLEVQKKTRTETINRINHTFKILHGDTRDLILRIRSEEDKRYYNYMINPEDWEKFNC